MTEADPVFWLIGWAILTWPFGVLVLVFAWRDGMLRADWQLVAITFVIGPLWILLLPFAMIRFGLPGRWRKHKYPDQERDE